MSVGTASDRELLSACADGDRAAFGELVGRHGRAVLAFARSRAAIQADADDLAQEAFVLLWERRSRIELVTDSVLPWLLVTVRFKAMDRAKTAARRATDPIDSADAFPAAADDEPPEAARRRALAAAIDGVVAGLPALDRELLQRCLVDGDSYEAAAAELGLSHGQVRGRLARLRARLRGELTDAQGGADR